MIRTVTLALAAMLLLPAPAAWSRSPEASPAASPAGPVTLRIDARRRMTLDGIPTSEQKLMTTLSRVTGGDHERVLVVQPDARVRFGQVEALLHRLGEAGYTRVVLHPLNVKDTPPPPIQP